MRLQGKTAIVTGAASGFGAGISRKFAAEGAKVMVADVNLEGAQVIAAEIGGVAQLCNVADPGSVLAMKNAVLNEFGHLDILVNNAGATHLPNEMENVTIDDFEKVYGVNIKSVYLTAQAFIAHFKERGSGVILNVASTGGVSPRPRLTWYNASKGWMITATKAMAVELAPFNVRVNAIAPVAGKTPLLKSFMGGNTKKKKQTFLSTIPLGRFSTPQDMGNAACFLCSDEASMITGTVLEVDGGRCI